MALLVDHLPIIHQQVTNLALYPREIWVPWYKISGNPEIQNMDLWVLDDAYAESWVNFIFWQPHLVSDMDILLNYGNPELKNICSSYLSHIM